MRLILINYETVSFIILYIKKLKLLVFIKRYSEILDGPVEQCSIWATAILMTNVEFNRAVSESSLSCNMEFEAVLKWQKANQGVCI